MSLKAWTTESIPLATVILSLKGHRLEHMDAVAMPPAVVAQDRPQIWDGTAIVEVISFTAPGTFWKGERLPMSWEKVLQNMELFSFTLQIVHRLPIVYQYYVPQETSPICGLFSLTTQSYPVVFIPSVP